MNLLILILAILIILLWIWVFWADDKAPDCGCFPDSDPYPINWIPYTGFTGYSGYTGHTGTTGAIGSTGPTGNRYQPFRAYRLTEDQIQDYYNNAPNSITYDIPRWEDYRYHGHTGYSGNINRNKKEARPSWAKYLKAK